VPPARAQNNYYLDPNNQTQSNKDCGLLGGSWDGASCNIKGNAGLAAGDAVFVDPGAFLKVYGSTFTANGDIEVNGGTLFVDSTGSVIIGASGRLDNNYYNNACAQFGVNNYGKIINSGTIGTSCDFYDQPAARLTNAGGAFIFAAGGTFKNEGGATIVNMKGGAFQDLNGPTSVNPGLVYNYGDINNSGYLQLYSGTTITYTKSGYFKGTFNSVGNLNMLPGSTLTVGYGGIASVPTVLDVAAGANLTIPKGVTLYVGSSATLKVEQGSKILNNGELSSQSGQATYNAGMVNDSGVITNYLGATINDNGTFQINKGASLNNWDYATFETAQYNGIMYNDGTFQNYKDGSVYVRQNAIINNNALVWNSGNFSVSKTAALNNNEPGSFYNDGDFSNDGNVTSFAAIKDNTGGVIENAGVMEIPGAIEVYQGAAFNNSADGLTSIEASGALNIYQGGTVVNGGAMTNSGSVLIVPKASFVNSGGGTFASVSKVDNYGTLTNKAGATLHNNEGGDIELWGHSLTTNVGTINNNDTIVQHCYAIYNNTGTYTGNPVTVQPCGSVSATVTTVSPNPSSVAPGGVVTFKAVVRDAAGSSAATPTGWVAWTDGKAGGLFSMLGVCQLSAGTCSINYTAPVASSYELLSINATYSGDQVHVGSGGGAKLGVGTPTASTTSTTASTTRSTQPASTSTSGSATTNTTSGSGVPEFPMGTLGVVTLALVLVVAYLVTRHRRADLGA
jgi:hypothetical protein